MYINNDINFSLSFTSSPNSPIHLSKFLFNFHFSNSIVQSETLVHLSLQLSIVQSISPNSCPLFTPTTKSPIH